MEGVAPAHINDVARRNLPPKLFSRRLFFDEEKHVGSTFQELTKIFLDELPVFIGIRTRCGIKRSMESFSWLGGSSLDQWEPSPLF
jgi:hypothetical protein